MYVGDIHDGSGLHHLLWEVVANSLDQFLMGKATRIDVVERDGSIEVRDDGPGIPLDIVEEVFTKHHYTPTFDDHAPHVHIGFVQGLGLAPVCAVCEHVRVEIRSERGRFAQEYSRGYATGTLDRCGDPSASGTTVTLKPDPEIFSTTEWDGTLIRSRMRELAALLPGLLTSFERERFGPSDLRDLVPNGVLDEPLYCVAEEDQMTVRIALSWSTDEPGEIHSFANAMRTREGSHEKGFMSGLAGAFATLGADIGKSWVRPYEKLSKGLTAAVSVMLIDPQYGAPTRDRLVHPRVRKLVDRTLVEQLPALLNLVPALRDELLARL